MIRSLHAPAAIAACLWALLSICCKPKIPSAGSRPGCRSGRFGRLLACALLAAAACWSAAPAQAGIGVNLNSGNATYLTEIGGSGGSSFAPHFCPDGQVISGVNFEVTPVGNGKGFQGRCSKLDTSGNLSAGGTTAWVRGPENVAMSSTSACPAGSVFAGWKPYLHNYSGADWVIAGFDLYCAPFDTTAAGVVSIGLPSASGGRVGNVTTRVGAPETCPAGSIASGFQGRVGYALNAMQLICYSLSTQTLTAVFAVTPTPSSYEAFGLDVRDGSGTVSFRPPAGSDRAAHPMTVGSYTTAPVVPAAYRLIGNTCATNLQMSTNVDQTCTVTATVGVDAGKSSIRVVTDRQIINSTAPDVLQAVVRDGVDVPVAGLLIRFSGFADCTTDNAGQCQASKIGTAAGTFTTTATANGVSLGTLTYQYVVGPPSAPNATIAVATDNQVANGSAADVLTAIVRDSFDNPLPGITVTFAATAGVDLGPGPGNAFDCTTDAAGKCTVDALSKRAGAYGTAVALGSTSLGTLNYTFVPGPVSLARSGVRAATDNAFGNGTSQDVLEALVRDAHDNPVVAGSVVSFAAAGADVAFDGGPRGGTGSCVTLGSTGACRVTATSSSLTGGARTTVVTLGGNPLAGSFTTGGATYGPSPLAFNFAAWVPRLQIVKQVSNGTGSHTFTFNLTGLQAASDTLTVTGAASASGANLLGSMPARPITITEVASSDWPDAPVSASCVDLASATPTATFGTLVAQQLTIPAANSIAGANLRCTFVNARRATVSGRLFTDDGAGGGTANDGIANGAEQGLPGAAVSLGDCAAAVHATALTDAGGRYSLPIPPSVAPGAALCIDSPSTLSRHGTGASVANTALPPNATITVGGTAFTYTRSNGPARVAFARPASHDAGVAGIDLASVARGSLVQSAIKTGLAGTSVAYAHVYTAGTAGNLRFSVVDPVSTPATPGWSQRVYADAGCTSQLQPGAAMLFPPSVAVPVTAGKIVCVIVLESIPPSAAPDSRDDITLQASLDFANASAPLSATYSLHDVTTVTSQTLQLTKEVRNVSQGVSTFGIANRAKPGDTLEYRITFTNGAPTPIRNLKIHDATPSYTTFRTASAGTLPHALTGCAKSTPADQGTAVECSVPQAAGRQGALQWTFTGELASGASGTVLFQVVVDP